MFIHLHTHSYYSFLSGVPSPRQLVEQAVRSEMPALALTDKGRLTGSIEFYETCRKEGVQPILGLEVPVCLPGRPERPAGNLVLLAMDLKGWSNLCRLSSELYCNPGCTGGEALSFEQLTWDTQGLLCLTGGQTGLAARLLQEQNAQEALRYLGLLFEVFGDRLYLELFSQQPSQDPQFSAFLQIAARLKIPAAAANPVFYLNPQQAHLQQVLSGIRLNKPMSDLGQNDLAPPDSYFYSAQVMQDRFAGHSRMLENTLEIAGRCRLELPLGQLHYPQAEGQQGDSLKLLRRKAFAGARGRLGEMNETIRERLDYELSVIDKSGYTSLFLIMEEIIQYVRKADIPYSSRGSAGSSLVAFCLGITIPDPLRLNLYFERFLNPARHSPPDIDTDLDSNRRDRVIRHVYEKYGSESVAMVATINRFRSRSALREVAKTYGLSQSEISRISSALPRRWGPPHRDKSADTESPFDVLAGQFPQEKYRRIFADARALLDFPHHLSVHPGGVVIAPGKMTDLTAVQPANKGVLITQFDLEMVERIGLVKIDLLGTRGLSVLGDVADAARQRLETAPRRLEFLENIPDEDEETSELVFKGGTVGCFAIESPGMQRTLREISARSIDDIMVALALYRPGPMSGGLKDAFVRRHLGLEKTSDLHPALRELLAETYGVILYQEQVLKVAHELAGFSLADADLLRRAMSHFDPGERMQTLRRKFVAGAEERHGVPPQSGERIWEMMAAFAGYGFPKAHSASYARVAWRSAWCKAHYPAEFLAGVLANWGGYYRQDVYLLEARRLGLQVKGPDVNHSQAQFSVIWQGNKPILYMGLGQVRDLTRQTIKRIVQTRPFDSLSDFILRVQPRPKEMEYLVQVGALDRWGSIPALLRQAKKRQRRSGQLSLFAEEPEVYESVQDWSPQERAVAQKKLLGASLSAHPLELLAGPIERLGAVPIREAGAKQGQTLRVAGICQRWRKGVRSGQGIFHTVLDDLTAGVMLVAGEAEYKRYSAFLNSKVPLVVEGRMEKSRETGEPVLFLKRVFDPEVE